MSWKTFKPKPEAEDVTQLAEEYNNRMYAILLENNYRKHMDEVTYEAENLP